MWVVKRGPFWQGFRCFSLACKGHQFSDGIPICISRPVPPWGPGPVTASCRFPPEKWWGGGLVWGQGIVSEHMKMAYRAPWRLRLSWKARRLDCSRMVSLDWSKVLKWEPAEYLPKCNFCIFWLFVLWLGFMHLNNCSAWNDTFFDICCIFPSKHEY